MDEHSAPASPLAPTPTSDTFTIPIPTATTSSLETLVMEAADLRLRLRYRSVALAAMQETVDAALVTCQWARLPPLPTE